MSVGELRTLENEALEALERLIKQELAEHKAAEENVRVYYDAWIYKAWVLPVNSIATPSWWLGVVI